MEIKQALPLIINQEDLTRDAMRDVMRQIMSGEPAMPK